MISLDLVTSLLRITFRLSVPYILAATGEVVTQRSGIFNVGIEGVMLMGAITAYVVTVSTGSHLMGFSAAILMGLLIGVIIGYLLVFLKMDQTLAGILIWIFGIGMSALIYRIIIGVRASPPLIETLPELEVPVLSQIPILGPSLFSQNILVYLSCFLIVPIIHLLLFRTTIGLRIRAVGENPRAADTLGINVDLIRYLTFIFATSMQALAGAYLPLVETAVFTVGMTGGRGWISLQLVIFGKWVPSLIFGGSLLFAFVEGLAFKVQLLHRALPYQFVLMLPYVVTLIALVIISRRAVMPRALGIPYEREEAR